MAVQSWLPDFFSATEAPKIMSKGDNTESVECGDYVIIESKIPKKELENVINEKVRYKLQVDWFKDWYALLTDPRQTRKRREKDTPWPSVSDDLSKEEIGMIKYYQDGFIRLWQWIQSHSVLVNQIHRVYQSCISEGNRQRFDQKRHRTNVRKSNDSTEYNENSLNSKDYVDEMTDAMAKLHDLETLFLDRKSTSVQNEMNQLQKELEKVQTEAKQATSEKENALSRLSQLAADRLRVDNSAVTDLSDLHRPTNLADKFNELYDNEWTDAFDHMTTIKGKGDEDAINNLLDIVKDVYSACQICAVSQRNDIQNDLNLSKHNEQIPCSDFSSPEPFSRTENRRIQHVISEFQKNTTEFSLPILKKKIKEDMCHTQSSMYIQHNRMTPFVDKCIELCWYMNIQEKPVVLLFDAEKGSTFRTDLYRHFTKSGSSCDFLVWPAMLLHDNGPLLQKGVIQPE